MSPHESSLGLRPSSPLSRRRFLAGTAVTTAALAAAHESPTPAAEPDAAARQIKLGVVGLGGRGGWIANLFRQHGGYEMHAVADYFPEVSERVGKARKGRMTRAELRKENRKLEVDVTGLKT